MHKDHLGSSTVMTNDSGFETESAQYMPYGSIRPGSGEITETSYLYTDQEFDTENGLYNYDARLYDPVIGRFISPDTIVPNPLNPQSLNRYTYCLNNPLIYVDPSGHQEEDEFQLEDVVVRDSRWDFSFGGSSGGAGGTGPYGGTNYLGIGVYEQWKLEQVEAEARRTFNDGVNEDNNSPEEPTGQEGRPLTDREKILLGPYIPQVDLDNARIHIGIPWWVPNRDNLRAITIGNDIYMSEGEFDSFTIEGIALLGHELVHVGQYRNGANWWDFIWSYAIDGYQDSKYEIPAWEIYRQIIYNIRGTFRGGRYLD